MGIHVFAIGGSLFQGWEMKKVFTRYVTVSEVLDGDTVKGDLDLGDGVFRHAVGVRMLGVDTPELHSKNPIEAQAAAVVRNFVASRLIVGQEYRFVSLEKADKYGRALGRIDDGENNDMATVLLTLGYAREYSGERKLPWTDEDLNKIIGSPAAPCMGGTMPSAVGAGTQSHGAEWTSPRAHNSGGVVRFDGPLPN